MASEILEQPHSVDTVEPKMSSALTSLQASPRQATGRLFCQGEDGILKASSLTVRSP